MTKTYHDVLDSAAGLQIPDSIDLFPNVSAQLSQRKTFMQTMRARPALALLIAVLALLLLTGIVYAIGRSLGYIPGVGIVEQDTPIRVLDGKPGVQRDGITLTMKQLVVDSSQTEVMYRTKGISMWSDAVQECAKAPSLLLENGSRLESTGGYRSEMGGENGILGFDANFIFSPLPADTQKVTLLTPCQLPALTLHLVPAPEGFVLPATEIPATFDSSRPSLPAATSFSDAQTPAPPAYPTDFPATPTPVPHGSGLYLEKAVELEKSYLLVGNFTDAGDLPGSTWAAQSVVPYEFHITDRNGKPVSFFYRPDLMPPSGWANVTYWALEVLKPLDAPLTVTLPEMSVFTDDIFRFPVNVGAHPTIGQTWQLNQAVQVGGHSFLVEKITLEERGYTLALRSLTPISREDFFLNMVMEEKSASLLSERFHERDGVLEVNETLVFDDPPSGELTFVLNLFVENSIGPWTLTWSPPGKP